MRRLLIGILCCLTRRIVRYFNTDLEKYSVIFTSGATAALKTVAECFAWSANDEGDLNLRENIKSELIGTALFTNKWSLLHFNAATGRKSTYQIAAHVSNARFDASPINLTCLQKSTVDIAYFVRVLA